MNLERWVICNMGFSFNKASQAGGGKICRRAVEGWTAQGSPTYLQATTTPTSPQFFLNNNVSFTAYPTNAWTGFSAVDTSGSISPPSTAWVDLINIGFYETIRPTEIIIDDSTFQPQGIYHTENYRVDLVFDVYGYGISATAKFASSEFIDIGVILPQTPITTGGYVYTPSALSGYSVLRDV